MMDIKRATELLRGLADGVNPLTGEMLPETCICNQVELVRAFHTILAQLSDKTQSQTSQRPNTGKPWTVDEENSLIEEFDAGINLTAIAKAPGRSRGAIKSRLEKLGKIDKTYPLQ